MADLLSVLNQAVWSLGAHRAAAATAGHNLQNVNTPGYSRQRVSLSAAQPSEVESGQFLGRGVMLGQVTQVRDRFVEAQVPGALAAAARSSAESRSLDAVTVLNTTAPDGLGRALDGFFGSLRTLSQSPGDASLRQTTIGSARTLAAAFNRTAGALASVRDGIGGELANSAGEVTELASRFADLNARIRAARATGAEPTDLLDLRQGAQDRLIELTGASPVPDASGDIALVLARGGALVSGDRAAALATLPDPTNGGRPALRLVPASGKPVTLAAADVGGALGGLLSARDGTLASAEARLDALACDLATALNTRHAAGTGLDGSTGRSMFDVGTTSAGAASRLSLSAALVDDPRALATTAGGGAGDGTNLQSILDVERSALAGGRNPASTLAGIVAGFGSDAARARSSSDQDSAYRAQVDELRSSASGVSIDDEVVAMTRAQRGYEAVSRVVATTNALLDTLLSLGKS